MTDVDRLVAAFCLTLAAVSALGFRYLHTHDKE